MKYDFVPLHEVVDELYNNKDIHYGDIKKKEGYGAGNIDWEVYLQLSNAGRCRVLTARNNDKLIGYSVFIIINNANHKSFICAINVAVFISKEYRGKIIGEMIKEADIQLEKLGVMETNFTLIDKRMGILLKRQKYESTHVTWRKRYATFFDTIAGSNGK